MGWDGIKEISGIASTFLLQTVLKHMVNNDLVWLRGSSINMAAQLGWLEGRGAAAIGSPQLGERSLEAAAVGAVARRHGSSFS